MVLPTYDQLHNALFKALIILLPLNLGKHFVASDAYVRGILVDYLIPTIYISDLLLLFLLLFWLLDVGYAGLSYAFAKNRIASRLLFLFLLTLSLSTLASINQFISFSYLLRTVLYVCLAFYVLANYQKTFRFRHIVMLLAYSVGFVSLLAIVQWYLQGSVFNNYLAFGEQVYSASTRGVAIENVLGVAYIPSYGTFRHPNILGGFLSITLVWLFSFVHYNKKLLLPLFLGVFALFFTFSQIAWIAFALGLLFLLIKNIERRTYLPIFVVGLIVFAGISLHLLPMLETSGIITVEKLQTNPSYYRRAALTKAAFEITKQYPFFGTGPNTNTLVIEDYTAPTKDLRFVQPIHNIFLLLLSESGVFALALFMALLLLTFSKKASLLFFVSVLQFLVLGSFDHYLLTIHQMQMLFWLTLGLNLTYNSIDYV